MVCTDYKVGYKKTISGIEYDIVLVSLVTTSTPASLSFDATGIENFPKNYNPSKVKFMAGSTLIVTGDGTSANPCEMYVANESYTFVKIS